MTDWIFYHLTTRGALVSDAGLALKADDGTTLRFESLIEAQDYLMTINERESVRSN